MPSSDVSSVRLRTGRKVPRARDLGVPFEGKPGSLNAITDVAGVEVGYATLVKGDGKLVVGRGPVRTGVTAILPTHGAAIPVFAGGYSHNGNGEMTGMAWVEESGMLEGPVLITNTHSVGAVHAAAIKWAVEGGRLKQPWLLPVVAETYDGFLNDINGFHVGEEHVFAALEGASSGLVAEGNVGGGTGMGLYGFKGGNGTASRQLTDEDGAYIVGVFVQANFGERADLVVAGVPVGREIHDLLPTYGQLETPVPSEYGSVIAALATDAPLLPHQLERLARRVSMGLARTGGVAENGSGELFIAFSTASLTEKDERVVAAQMLRNDQMTPLFRATVQATEEAVINALVAAETMTGQGGNTRYALPHDRLQALLRKYNRFET